MEMIGRLEELTGKVNINMRQVVEEEEVAGSKAIQELNNDLSDDGPITNMSLFVLFSALYLLQGIISGVIGTMPYIYPTLPDYNSMALFNANLLPFSFKFIIAPFLQKFSLLSYGKRKTWMTVGTAGGSLTMLIASFFTAQKYSNLMALLFILAQTCMAILDIAAHAAMIKELRSKSQTSIIIGYSQTVGILMGGLILLKLTSPEFSTSVGLSHPITSPQILLLIFGGLIMLPAIYMHCWFKELQLQSEKKGDRFSFCQIIGYYRVCLQSGSRYFRTCVLFLVHLQGMNFFNCLYDYELVKAGFSKDLMNTLANVLVIPTIIFTFYFGAWTNRLQGRLNSLIFVLSIMVAFNAYLAIVFPLNVWVVVFTSFVVGVMDTWRFYLCAYMINDFAPHALTGMFITFMASFSNFGKEKAPHTWIAGKLGWKPCALVGLALQVVIIILLPSIYRWMQSGDSDVPEEIKEDDKGDEQKGRVLPGQAKALSGQAKALSGQAKGDGTNGQYILSNPAEPSLQVGS